jgi:hypothetical protein
MHLTHDSTLRETAHAIYNTVYPTDEWTPVTFDEAERCGTIHYRQAVDAAIMARTVLVSRGTQLTLSV